MAHHELKIQPRYFAEVRKGAKTFEIRYNDRDYCEGDTVLLREFDSLRGYTGYELPFTIGYVTRFEQQEGYVVFSLLKGESDETNAR